MRGSLAVVVVVCCAACTSPRQVLSEHFALVEGDTSRDVVATLPGGETYLGTCAAPGAEQQPGDVPIDRSARLWALAPDGRALLYVHDAARAGSDRPSLGSGVYRADAAGRRALLFGAGDLSAFEGRYPKPLPPDVLVVELSEARDLERTRRALFAEGRNEPLAALGGTALHRAAWDGDPAALAEQLAARPTVDARNTWGLTALDLAVIRGHVEIVDALLAARADPEAGAYGALALAVSYGRTDVLESLLGPRAPGGTARRAGGRALLLALAPELGDVDAVHALLGDEPSPLTPRTVALLVERGADPNTRDAAGRTPVWWATRRADVGTLRRLLAAGGELSVRDAAGNLPLHGLFGADERSSEGARDWQQRVRPMLELVIASTPDLDARNAESLTPLQLAVREGALRSAELLVEHGADDGAPYLPAPGEGAGGQSLRERIEELRAEWSAAAPAGA